MQIVNFNIIVPNVVFEIPRLITTRIDMYIAFRGKTIILGIIFSFKAYIKMMFFSFIPCIFRCRIRI